MNPCGLAVDFGRDYAHVTNIYPFRDRPDIGVPALFWPIDLDADHVPWAQPFNLRNWDRLEQLPPPILGTRYDDKVYYTGPLPDLQPGTPTGTVDEWQNGLLYSKYIAGEYSTDCLEWVMPSYVIDLYSPNSTLTVDPHDGHVLVDIDLGHSNTWTATQQFQANVTIDVSALTSYMGFVITGDRGSGPTDILQVQSDGITRINGQLSINGTHAVNANKLEVALTAGQTGILVKPVSGSPTTGPFLQCQRGGGSNQFVIAFDGSLWTNQAAAATSPGSVVAAMPIYDQDGTLLGYLPIYDSIT